MSDTPPVDVFLDDVSDTVSEISTTTSYIPFTISDGTSETSEDHDVSMRSSSPTRSVVSMTSSMREQAFIREYGRNINNYSEVYKLPADEEELERLQKQHLLLREVLGKYPPVLAEVLADDVPGETKTCLDLGCGSGGWIMEVATDFPHCRAVAVDLIPLQSISMPPNCRSEVDDVNLGLEHYYGDFNVANARLISGGVRDFEGLIDHMGKVLRPGGLISLGEFSFYVYDADKKLFEGDTGPPWIVPWTAQVRHAIRTRGGSPEVASQMLKWVQDNGAFEDIVGRAYYMPVSPWMQGDDPEAVRLRRVGELAREDSLGFIDAARGLLLGSDIPESVVDELKRNVVNELLEGKAQVYSLIQTVYARKKHTVPDPIGQDQGDEIHM